MPSKTKLLVFLLMCGLATNLTAQAAKYRNYRGIVNGVHAYDTVAVLFPNDQVADDYGPRLNNQNDHRFISQGNGLTGGQDSIPRGVITVEYFQDNAYYVFHRADGSIVKRVRYDSFPDHSPYANLDYKIDSYSTNTNTYSVKNASIDEKKVLLNLAGIHWSDSLLLSFEEISHYTPYVEKPCGLGDTLDYVMSVSVTSLFTTRGTLNTLVSTLYKSDFEVIKHFYFNYSFCSPFCLSYDSRFVIFWVGNEGYDFEELPYEPLVIYDFMHDSTFSINLEKIFNLKAATSAGTVISGVILRRDDYFEIYAPFEEIESNTFYIGHVVINPKFREVYFKSLKTNPDFAALPIHLNEVRSLFNLSDLSKIENNKNYTKIHY
ncbi:MAG: hypothetical protein SFV52_12595 [Saprospiraceae bacterium]|nr:hypothetical protein [Saprospiraceae bacterium]